MSDPLQAVKRHVLLMAHHDPDDACPTVGVGAVTTDPLAAHEPVIVEDRDGPRIECSVRDCYADRYDWGIVHATLAAPAEGLREAAQAVVTAWGPPGGPEWDWMNRRIDRLRAALEADEGLCPGPNCPWWHPPVTRTCQAER